MFKLLHGLREGFALNPNQVANRNADVVEPHLVEVASIDHVANRSDFDTRRVHWNNDFADTEMWLSRNRFGSTDQIAIVRFVGERGPNLLTVNDPFIAIANCRGAQ